MRTRTRAHRTLLGLVIAALFVLVIGSKLSPSDTAWENRALLDPTRQNFVQLDIEPRNASWNYPAEQVLIGDAAIILDQLIDEVRSRGGDRCWSRRAPAPARRWPTSCPPSRAGSRS